MRKTWIYRWAERKYPRPTGMIWRGGLLGYRWPIGPRTQVSHAISEALKGLDKLLICQSLPQPSSGPMPARTGNQIKFFTYALGGPNA